MGTLRSSSGGADGSKLVFHPFDVVDRVGWGRRVTMTLDDRKDDLRVLSARIRSSAVAPVIGRRVECPSRELLEETRDRYMRQGLEGAMFKPSADPYQFKRSDSVLKIKRFMTHDATVVDVQEGGGKYTGMLGALVVELDGVQFNVGSGYTDAERVSLWGVRNLLRGRCVEVKYQNKTAKGKGRFPTYVCMRPDKDGV